MEDGQFQLGLITDAQWALLRADHRFVILRGAEALYTTGDPTFVRNATASKVAGFARLLLLVQQLIHLRLQRGVDSGKLCHQLMLRRKLHAGSAEDGVDAGSKHTYALLF